jgi:bacterioferritin-associated ferredoxin
MFLCAAMTDADIEGAIAAADESFKVVRKNLRELAPHAGLATLLQGRRR